MRSLLLVVLLSVTVGGAALLHLGGAAPVRQDGITVWFSPRGGCAQAIVEQIRSAGRSVDVAAYAITHPDIAAAIVAAHRRGLGVRVLMDDSQSQQKYSSATYLFNAGVPVWIWKSGMMHNKFVLIDDRRLLTGSFNFTRNAEESNAENLLLIENKPRVLAAYRQEFEDLLRRSRKYEGLVAENDNPGSNRRGR